MAKPVFLGFCNPLLDVSAEVPLEVFQEWEIEPGSATLATDKQRELYKVFQEKFPVEYIAGGAGQNSVRAFQWMVGKDKAGWGAYIGSIGNDENGKRLKEAAEKEGVVTEYMIQEGIPTGSCAVLIHKKERSLIAALNAAEKYNESHYNSPPVQKLLESVQFFYATSFVLTHSPLVVQQMGKHAIQHKKSFAINISAPFLVQFFWDSLNPVLKMADLVFANENEAAALGEKLGFGSDLEEIAKKVGEYEKEGERKRTVVFTQGKDKTIVYSEGKVSTFQPLSIPVEQIVDTNGAGDSFVGGFFSRYVQGKPLEECVAAGHYCAYECIKLSGASYPSQNLFSYP